MGTQQTLHDFTLTLLGDLDAREAFQLDPEGTLQAAGLGDISPVDVHEILPLVLDSASVVKIDAVDEVLAHADDLTGADSLKLITGDLDGVTGIAGLAAPSSVTALVTDFGDVSGTLDLVGANEVVADVTDIATDNSVVSKVTDVVDVDDVTGVAGDIDSDVLLKDVVDSDVLVKNVISDVDVKDVVDLSHNVVQDVAQVGDVHTDLGQVIDDVKVGDIDLLHDGIGNGNVDIHF